MTTRRQLERAIVRLSVELDLAHSQAETVGRYHDDLRAQLVESKRERNTFLTENTKLRRAIKAMLAAASTKDLRRCCGGGSRFMASRRRTAAGREERSRSPRRPSAKDWGGEAGPRSCYPRAKVPRVDCCCQRKKKRPGSAPRPGGRLRKGGWVMASPRLVVTDIFADTPVVLVDGRIRAIELLRRIERYVTEDKAVTPGCTRLARVLVETRKFLDEHDARKARR